MSGKRGMKKYPVGIREEVVARVVSRIFRKMVCRLWHESSQPAMEASSRAASRCFMFMYFLLPYWVPATWRNRAQTSMRAEFPSGKLPTTRVRQRRGRAACAEGFAGKGAPAFGLKRARRRAFCLCSHISTKQAAPKGRLFGFACRLCLFAVHRVNFL